MEDESSSFCSGGPEAGTDAALQRKMRRAYYRFKCSDSCTSLLKEVLNHDVFHAFKDRRTQYGGSFWDVIQAGATYMKEPIGIYAPDPDAYAVFGPLFNVAIDELHLGFPRDAAQPKHTWGNYKVKIRSPDPAGRYIQSTRIRLCRNLAGYPFAPRLTRALYKEIEAKVLPAFELLPYDLEGKYFPLDKLRDEVQKELRDEHVLFARPNKFLRAANVGRFWPTGRGLFMNEKRDFLVWVGKDDHLRVVSMSKGHDLQGVYRRLIRGAMVLEECLDFAHDDRLGYLTLDPANLGTTLRASYLIRLPLLAEQGAVEELARKHNLEVRGTYGARRPVKDGLYNIANRRRLGLTEYEAIMELQLGISKLIYEEQALEGARHVEELERLSAAAGFDMLSLLEATTTEDAKPSAEGKAGDKKTAKKKNTAGKKKKKGNVSFSDEEEDEDDNTSRRSRSSSRKRTPTLTQSETIVEESEEDSSPTSSSSASASSLVKRRKKIVKKKKKVKKTDSERELAFSLF